MPSLQDSNRGMADRRTGRIKTIVHELILLTLTGEARPGVTAELTDVLKAHHNVTVLDIGQSVIHNTLSLGVLILVPENEARDALLSAVEAQASTLGLNLQSRPVTEDAYNDWVAEQGKSRHIITLLAHRISAAHIARVTGIAAEHGLTIDSINRLSGRVALDETNADGRACVEFSVRNLDCDEKVLREAFLAAATELDVDIALQRDDIFRRNRRVVVFDMDSTLIKAEVIDELAKEAGVGDQVAAITESAMRGELDFNQSFRKRVGLLKGMDESVLQKVAARLPLNDGIEELMGNLRALGFKTAILSGGFTYFARGLQQKLGFDYVYANELDFKDGKLTGEVKGEIVNGQRKAELLREIAANEGVRLEQTIAVGDGANDLPMLSIAGLGIAFRAKPLVRKNAQQAITTLGLDGVLYLIGFRDQDRMHRSNAS